MEVLLEVLVSKGLEMAIEEIKRIRRVPKDIQRLITTVDVIKKVLKDAEKKQISEDAVRSWLQQLKQVFLDAEDLLDEIITDAALASMSADGRKKVRAKCLRSFIYKIKRRIGGTARQIQDINKKLDDLANLKDKYSLQVSPVENKHVDDSGGRLTSSFLVNPVIGRDSEKKEIKKLLLSSSCEAESSNSMNFSILPIVGMGGLGKTTLARFVYNDKEVNDHFELKMWVCVSNDFDHRRLTREIIEAASASKGKNEQCPNLDNWNSLQQKLGQEVEGKTFLLVLDDVWVINQWDDLVAPLNFAKKGSKIVMTSRSSNAVEINQGLLPQYTLYGLSDDDLWSLFKGCAFYGRSPQEYSHLLETGRQIVNRLKGLPLAARVIGNLLRTRLELPYWREIGTSRLLELEQGEGGILPALGLSYQYLPGNLRQCFAYCSLFPEDHDFDKTELTRLWDAQCYSEKEGISNEYFDNLQCRSFFEPSDYGRYVMHDLIHDLAEHVSKDDCFRLDDKKSMEIPETVRHVSVYDRRFDQAKLNQLRSREKLRTLLFSHRCYFDDMTRAVDELLLKLKRLRVLGLPYCGIRELPSSVGDLKHLRYINLSHNPFKNLPESLCNLYNLQVLDLRGCDSLVALPTRMSQLINLGHLVVDSTSRHLVVNGAVVDLVSRIDGLGKLTRLQELEVGGSKIRELGGMDMLRELEINHMEEVRTQEDAVEARLHSKKDLRKLKLVWSPERDPASINRGRDEGTLQALQPVDTVKDLRIEGYGGVKSPGWMEDPAVRFSSESLKLYSCPNWEVLPSLGQLCLLKSLKIHDCPKLRELPPLPPTLEGLHLLLPSLGQLCRLKSLEIHDCPKLRELPPLPPTLEGLYLNDVGLTSVLGMWGCRGSGGDGGETSPSHSTSPALAHVSISNCPNLTSLSGLLQHPLTALRVLEIKYCEELQSLTERGMGHLVSLEELYIIDCPKLTTTCSPLVSLPLPSSLHRFELRRCGDAMGGWWWAGLHRLTCLAHLDLVGCPTTAASFFLSLGRHPRHRLAATLTELYIRGCGSGNSVPNSSSPQPSSGGVFRSLTSLKTLELWDSRHLLQEWAGGGLPSSLEDLDIRGDDDLDDGCLATCLRDLTCLKRLDISCPAITSLPDCLRDLTSLTKLYIFDCPALTSLPDCLRDLTSDLSIDDCRALTFLPGVPAAGRRSQMTQLLSLTIRRCHKIESLPDGLLASLKSLRIEDCPRLKEQCGEQGCPDWHMISHIPYVKIDNERVI